MGGSSICFNFYAIPPLVGTLVFFVLGLVVLFNKPRTPEKIIFSVLCLETFYWQVVWLASFFVQSNSSYVTYLAKLAYLAITPLPFTFYWLIVVCLKKERSEKGYLAGFAVVGAALLLLLFSTDLFLAGNQHFSWGNFSKPGILYPIFTATALISMIRGLVLLRRSLQDPSLDVQSRNQMKYLFLGFCFYFFCTLDFLQVYGATWYPIGTFFFILASLTIAYTISKHQLLDIKIVVQKTLMYTFWTLFVSLGYACVIFLIQSVLLGGTFTHVNMASEATTLKRIPDGFYKWSGLLALLMNGGMALFVYLKNKKSLVSVKFVILSLFIGLWASGSWLVNMIPDGAFALWILRGHYGFGLFVPVLFLDFIVTFTRSSEKFWIRVGYGISSLLLAADFSSYFIQGLRSVPGFNFYITEPGVLYPLFVGYFCFYFFLAFLRLAASLKWFNEEERKQAKYVFLAYFVGMAAGIEYFCSVFGLLHRPPLDDYILIFTFLILTYAIAKHGLLDIRVVIKRTLYYSLLAFLISTFYVLVVFLAHAFFMKETISLHYLASSTLFILLIALFLRPIEAILHRLLDKKFFKGTISEISEQKALLETELERRERLKSVGILAAGMAHEIKNPLTAINTFADYLPEKYNDPEFREKFSRIVKQEVARVKEIVSDLLLFSKPADPHPRETDICKTLSDILELLSNDTLSHGIRVSTSLEEARAHVDPDQIKQALLNILMNAIDAMKEKGGELRVETSTKGNFVTIFIHDTGRGIPGDKIKHIFDPFFTSKEGGTGLGLAVTHSIIEGNRGTIEVKSEHGIGTTFTLRLPAR